MERSPTIEDREEEMRYYMESVRHLPDCDARRMFNKRINELKAEIAKVES